MASRQQILGVCWYRPEQWKRLKAISTDRDQLQDTYEDWEKDANRAIQALRLTGKIVKKVNVDLEQLLTWCNLKDIPVDGEARSEYVALIVQRESEAL